MRRSIATIAVQARQTLEETRWLLDPRRAIIRSLPGVIGWVDLQSPAVDAELEAIAPHPRLLGVRHVVQVGGARISYRPRRFAVGSGGSSATA